MAIAGTCTQRNRKTGYLTKKVNMAIAGTCTRNQRNRKTGYLTKKAIKVKMSKFIRKEHHEDDVAKGLPIMNVDQHTVKEPHVPGDFPQPDKGSCKEEEKNVDGTKDADLPKAAKEEVHVFYILESDIPEKQEREILAPGVLFLIPSPELDKQKDPQSSQKTGPSMKPIPLATEEVEVLATWSSQDTDPSDDSSRSRTRTQEREKMTTSKFVPDLCQRPVSLKMMIVLLLLLSSGANGDCDIGKASECPSSSTNKMIAVELGHSVEIGSIPNEDPHPYSLKFDFHPSSEQFDCKMTADVSIKPNCSVVLWEDDISDCPGLSLQQIGDRTAIMYLNVTEDLFYCTYIEGPGFYHYDQGGVFLQATPSATSTVDWWRLAFNIVVPILVLGLAIGILGYFISKRNKTGFFQVFKDATHRVLLTRDVP